MTLTVNIHTIICQFLCNNLKLLNTTFHKSAHLIQYFLLRTTHMLARNKRNGAICTTTVASLAYLYVCIMIRRCDMTLARACRNLRLSKIRDKLHKVELAIILVHLRNLFLQFLLITLRQTSHNKEFAYASLLLCLYQLQYSVYTLQLGILNKSTCIHHNNLAFNAFCVVCAMIAGLLKFCQQGLAVNKVLRATHCNNIYLSFLHLVL